MYTQSYICAWRIETEKEQEFKGFKLPNRKTNENKEAQEKYEEEEVRMKTKQSGTIIFWIKKSCVNCELFKLNDL